MTNLTDDLKPLVYRSDLGDRYLPVEYFPTYSDAHDEMADSEGWEDDEIASGYSGIQAIPLHVHDIEDYEACPNWDEEIGDEPEPCLGYVKCHAFEL